MKSITFSGRRFRWFAIAWFTFLMATLLANLAKADNELSSSWYSCTATDNPDSLLAAHGTHVGQLMVNSSGDMKGCLAEGVAPKCAPVTGEVKSIWGPTTWFETSKHGWLGCIEKSYPENTTLERLEIVKGNT